MGALIVVIEVPETETVIVRQRQTATVTVTAKRTAAQNVRLSVVQIAMLMKIEEKTGTVGRIVIVRRNVALIATQNVKKTVERSADLTGMSATLKKTRTMIVKQKQPKEQ